MMANLFRHLFASYLDMICGTKPENTTPLIKPEAVTRVYWTMVLINTYASGKRCGANFSVNARDQIIIR